MTTKKLFVRNTRTCDLCGDFFDQHRSSDSWCKPCRRSFKKAWTKAKKLEDFLGKSKISLEKLERSTTERVFTWVVQGSKVHGDGQVKSTKIVIRIEE